MTQEYFSVALTPQISLAIPLASIGKIVQLETKDICLVPGVSDFWYGVINLKGSLLWILDSDRYLNLEKTSLQIDLKNLAAVVIQQNQKDTQKKVALVTPQLEGIIAVEPHQLEPVPEHISPNLKKCCSNSILDRDKHTFILNPINFLKQLNQESALLSA